MTVVRNAPSALPATVRLMASRLAHRMRGGGHRPLPEFRTRTRRALQQLGDAAVSAVDWKQVSAVPAPWTDTGIDLPPCVPVTLIADGMVYAARALDIGFEPKVGLWFRVGSDGEIAKIVGNASSFDSGAGGRLWLTCKPSGEFADRRGAFEPAIPRVAFPGAFDVAIIQWRSDLQLGLASAAAIEPRVFGPALARLREPVDPPPGWHYLWRLGRGEIFQACGDAPETMCCHTRGDVGILQFPVDLALTEDSVVTWSWCVEQLPSKLPEHIEPTHDYLSLAVEFDNGLDLTWMWSAALPVDTIFQCPLAWWKDRETHWVVRSGTGELGRWVGERRRLADDYRRAIGQDLPKRIVAVWLIANTVFQRGEGKCRYRDIALEDATGKVDIRR